jgi:hypothetical protein
MVSGVSWWFVVLVILTRLEWLVVVSADGERLGVQGAERAREDVG